MDGQTFVFNKVDPTDRQKIESLKKNEHKSKILQGNDVYNKYKDEISRDDVIKGVTQTLLHHMQQANQQSADETAAMKTKVLAMRDGYDGELRDLNDIATALKEAREEKDKLAPPPEKTRTESKSEKKERIAAADRIKAQEKVIDKQKKAFDNKKKTLLKKAGNDRDKLNDLKNQHNASINEISNRYDDQAIKYYQLSRDDLGVLDDEHRKNIQKYVGYLPLERVEGRLDAIEQNPGTDDTLTIKPWQEPKPGIVADESDSNILHHQYIEADLLEGFDQAKGQIDVSSGEFKPVGSVTPNGESERDLQMDDFKANEKYRLGNYRVSAHSLDIHKVGAKKGTVYGVTIGGEFISNNHDLYNSKDDASLLQKGKVDSEKGRYARIEKVTDYIQRSEFFNHIFAENIEEYMKYEGDERGLKEQIASEIPDAANASSISIENYKKEDEGKILKSMYIEIVKGTNGGMQDTDAYINDILGKTSYSMKYTLVPKLVRMLILVANDSALKEKALQIAIDHGSDGMKKAAMDVLSANRNLAANNEYHFVGLLAACDESGEAPEFLQNLDTAMDFMTNMGVGDDNGALMGLINWNEVYGVLEGAIQTHNLVNVTYAKIKDKEKEMEDMDRDSDEYKEAEKELEELKKPSSDGIMGTVAGKIPGLLNSALEVIGSIKKIVEAFKDGKWLSDEHQAERDRGSKYITWLDYVFDTGDTIVGLLQSISEKVSDKIEDSGVENKHTERFGVFSGIFDTILEAFNIAKNVYSIVQSGRTMHEVSKSMDTINSFGSDTAQGKARDYNPQVLRFLAYSRQKAGKDIAVSSLEIATGAVSIASNFVDPVTKSILDVIKKGIGTVGALVTNFIHGKLSEKATLKAAFPNADDYDEVNKSTTSEFNSALQKTTGIKSKSSLAQVSRIFSAIDLHVLVKAAATGTDTGSWDLAKTAMGAFYNVPSNDDEAKTTLSGIPLSVLLDKVGEGKGWRAALQGALV